MANLIIGFPNLLDSATLSGGSWEASLPLTNLQDRRLAKKARTTNDNTSSTKFDIDLTRDRAIKLICLVKNNFSIDATYRIYGSAVSNFATTVYDSGVQEVWTVVYDSLDLEWEEDNFWDGKPSQEYLVNLKETSTLNLIHILTISTLARYWRVEIYDTANADGYVEIGRVFISTQWQVTNNILYGASLGYETNTSVDESLDGPEYFDVRTAYRNFKFELESYNYDEGHAKLLDISRQVGIDKEVFVIPDPDDIRNMTRRAFLGRLKSLNPIQYPYFDTNKAAYEVKEIV
jgi:hypothetical protein